MIECPECKKIIEPDEKPTIGELISAIGMSVSSICLAILAVESVIVVALFIFWSMIYLFG